MTHEEDNHNNDYDHHMQSISALQEEELRSQRGSFVRKRSDEILELVNTSGLDDTGKMYEQFDSSNQDLEFDHHDDHHHRRHHQEEEKKRKSPEKRAVNDEKAQAKLERQRATGKQQAIKDKAAIKQENTGMMGRPRPQVLKPYSYPASQAKSTGNNKSRPDNDNNKEPRRERGDMDGSDEMTLHRTAQVQLTSEAILKMVADDGDCDCDQEASTKDDFLAKKKALTSREFTAEPLHWEKQKAEGALKSAPPGPLQSSCAGKQNYPTDKSGDEKNLKLAMSEPSRLISPHAGAARLEKTKASTQADHIPDTDKAAVRGRAFTTTFTITDTDLDDTHTFSSAFMVASPSDLARYGRLRAQPGAMRIRGLSLEDDGDDDDDDDEASTEMSDCEDAEAQALSEALAATSMATDDPIQAVLVEEHEEEMDQEKARELAEREDKIRQRELELERKLQQMAAGTTVQAIPASPVVPTNQKKKGIFGFLKRGKKKNPAPAPKPAKRLSVTTELVSNKGEPASKLVNKFVEKQLGTSARTDAAAKSTLTEFAHQLNRKPNSSIPLLERDEIRSGKKVKSGKFNTVDALKTIVLDETWEYPASQREGVLNEQIDKQKELRADLVRKSQMKGNKYVVKYLRSDIDDRKREAAAMEIISEASLLSSLSHENIIMVAGMSEGSLLMAHGSFAPNYSFFFVMDRLEDNMLECLTKSWRRKVRGPQFFFDRVKVATDLASAIDYLHSLNIMYSDLKPENVGFDRGGSVKLFNFGGAKALTNSTQPYDASCTTISPYVGTHPYVAPEVAMKRPAGVTIDTYAFGIILWEIMTMKEPFVNLMIHEYTEKVIQKGKRPKLDKKTPALLNELMSACWVYEPSQRYSMKDIHLSLFQFQEQLDVPETKKGRFR